MIIKLDQDALIDGKIYRKGEIVYSNDEILGQVLVSEQEHQARIEQSKQKVKVMEIEMVEFRAKKAKELEEKLKNEDKEGDQEDKNKEDDEEETEEEKDKLKDKEKDGPTE